MHYIEIFESFQANMEVPLRMEKFREKGNYESSSLTLGFTIKGIHWVSRRMTLRCAAQIYDRYLQSTELILMEEIRPKLSSVVDNSSTQTHPQTRNHSLATTLSTTFTILIPTLFVLGVISQF